MDITKQELEDILTLYQMGVSIRDITLTLRIPYSQVYKQINHFKLILPERSTDTIGQFIYTHPLFTQLKKGVLPNAVIRATQADAR